MSFGLNLLFFGYWGAWEVIEDKHIQKKNKYIENQEYNSSRHDLTYPEETENSIT